jgi:flagellar biosynthetic protein FlhB
MAENADGMEKSEEPTSKRKEEAINKGQIGRSMDLSSAVAILVGFCALAIYGGDFVGESLGLMREFFSAYAHWTPSISNFSAMAHHVLMVTLHLLLPILLMLLLINLAVGVAQVGGIHFSTETIRPKLSNVFSLGAIKQIFGKQAYIELLKGIAKMSIIGYISYLIIKAAYPDILYMPDMEILAFCDLMLEILVEMLLLLILFLGVLGVADLIYQKRKTHNDLMMTKQEVKDEHKNSEGDPKVIAARKRMMFAMHQKFMMKELPTATVVITNPTHLAIALRYERGKDQAPLVVGKGADKLAERIKSIAREHDIPVVENKPLARAMYPAIEIGDVIPSEFFAGVAEVLALVFRSRGQTAL